MKIYHFNEQGQFTHEGTADKSPLEEGVFHLPANACAIEPPALAAGFVAMWNGEDWTIQAEPAAPAADPEPVMPTEAELKRAAILSRLVAIDSESIRPAREITASLVAGLPLPPFPVARLAALEGEAGKLRQELAAL